MIHGVEGRANEQGLPQRAPHTSHDGGHGTLLICIPKVCLWGKTPRTLVSLKSTWFLPNMRQEMPTCVWSKSSCWDLEDLEATVRRTLVPCRAHQVPPGATRCHQVPLGAMCCHGVASSSWATNDLLSGKSIGQGS